MTNVLCVFWCLSYSLVTLEWVNLEHCVVFEKTNSQDTEDLPGQVTSYSNNTAHLAEH